MLGREVLFDQRRFLLVGIVCTDEGGFWDACWVPLGEKAASFDESGGWGAAGHRVWTGTLVLNLNFTRDGVNTRRASRMCFSVVEKACG